ncbi:MAG: response regulator transcription factor [Microthrixaceae bacterium]
MATVLIVDDDLDMRILIRIVLEMSNTGLTIVGEATDGVEALQIWRDLDGPPDPDVIILDNHMPGPTGLEVAAQILEERPGQIIVMCTAFFDPSTRTQATELGITHCLPKRDIDLLPALVGIFTRR